MVVPLPKNTEMSFLKICNTTDPVIDFPAAEDLAKNYSYPLDPFQQHAICAIHKEENVLVTAKTGSGKTLVGEYQIAYSLRKGGRVFYTTPIKSLSNQKFHDLKEMFPSVGIVTGDIKFQPDAAVVIMTTECLRNMLYKKGTSTEGLGLTAGMSLTGLDAVIFDEVHYINNKERGKVWEETMILLPAEVKMIMLSATIDGAEAFASWIGDLKQKMCWLIPTSHRVVPLKHCVVQSWSEDPIVVMESPAGVDKFNDVHWDSWLFYRKKICDSYEDHKNKVAARRRGGYDDPVIKQGKEERPQSYVAELNRCAQTLSERSLLPALFFVFSRAACESWASKMEGSFVDGKQSAEIRRIISFHLHRYMDILQGLKQYHNLMGLLERGIAYHHSGLLPILKEIIEILFSKGFVKVMFCTETFAVGINMPTRTVVFLDLKKYDEGGLRCLATDEYIQMAGRAGRRGLDKEGLVLYLPSRDPISTTEAKLMMTGRKTVLRSRMDFHYDFLLKTLQSNNLSWLKISQDSFWFKQQKVFAEGQRTLIAELEEKIASAGITEEQFLDMQKGLLLAEKFKTSVNAAKKKAQAELEAWKNVHAGPQWLLLQKQVSSLSALKQELEREKVVLKEMEAFTAGPEATIRFLAETEFLKDVGACAEITAANLTLKGILATEVNESNPILLVEAYDRGLFAGLEADDIVLVLAAFILDKAESQGAGPLRPAVSDALNQIDDLAKMFQSVEARFGFAPSSFWDLSDKWLGPISAWLSGESASQICLDFGIYEGNLYKTLMSLNNMLNELLAIATYCQHTEMVEKLKGVGIGILRDIAINDSLYLRI